MKKWNVALVGIAVGLFVTGCDGNEDTPDPEPLPVMTVEDVPADPATGRDPTTGQPLGTTGRFTFYNLRTNAIVLDRENDDRSDSTSTNWDIAFRSSTILLNGNNSWGGQGGGVVVDNEFETVTEAPASGYDATSVGLESSSSVAWGVYDPAAMTVYPLAGKTIVLKTADGRYAKVKIVSYYKGAPEVVNPLQDLERYFTFDFSFQPDGSRMFEE